MKHRLLVLLLVGVGALAKAQAPTRPDVLHRLDRTTLAGRVDEIGDGDVIFYETASPKTKKTIARSQVWKIVFADGSVEVLNGTASAPPSVAARQPQPTSPPKATTRPDLIRLRGGDRVIEAFVESVDERNVQYRRATEPAGKIYTLAVGKVELIRYGDGREETFGKPAPAAAPAPTLSPPTVPARRAPTARVRPERPERLARFSLSASGDVAYVLSGAEWTDEKRGMGFDLGAGGSLSADVRITPWLALTASGGYLQWNVQRNFKDSLTGDLLFRRTASLRLIPLHLGLKVYPFRGLYLSPQAGYTLFSETDTEEKPIGTDANAFFKHDGAYLGYRGEVGYEYRSGGFKALLAVSYTTLLTTELGPFKNTQPLTYAGARLGVGLSF